MQRLAPPRHAARLSCAITVAAAILLAVPVAAAGSRHGVTAAGQAAGVVYGGVTAQDFPVVLETSRRGRLVARATIAIELTCTSGQIVRLPDGYRRLTVRRNGKFSASFGPETRRNPDGTSVDFEGSVSGRFNSSRSRASGTWTFKGTERDAAGAVTDTCDSGTVRWSVKQ